MTDSQQIRQLERRLADSEESADTIAKISALNDLAWALSDTDLKRAYALSETAYSLASSPADGAPPYEAGMAYSLRTQGYLNQRFGNHALGLSQLLKALETCQALQLDDGVADVLDGIAGIYGQIGDFPEALSFIHRQLDIAQRIGDQRRIANANNNLANIYLQMGDYTRTVDTLLQNLKIAAEIGFARMASLSLLNLAETALLTGDHDVARDYALRGQHVSREAGFELFEIYAHKIIGKIYLKMGNAAAAIPSLNEALALAKVLESKVVEVLILLELGRAYRDMQRLDLALDYLQQGVAVAQSIDAKSELSTAHLRLSEVYEQMGDAARALAHFKQHQALKELVAGEKAEQRLQVLQVVHDIETARREAEILRLKTRQLEQEITEQKKLDEALQLSHDALEQQVKARTAELSDTIALLKQEIAERERAEAALQDTMASLEQRVAARTEELATFFDLILLAGQGISLPEVLERVLPRVIEVTRSEAVGIDLFDAHRSALQLAAQQNLPEDIPTVLPIAELPLEFQRWLQRPNDPLSMLDVEDMPSLRSAFRTAGLQSYLGAQIRIGQRTEGVLSCFRFTERGYSVDETALILALAHQIGMILEINHLRQNTEAMAVLEERQRLARDLHDSVTQSLYSLSLFSRAAREAEEDGDADRLRRSLAELERNTLHTLREMRLLLYELRPADLEHEGLISALELRLNTVERRVGLQLDVQMDAFPDLPRRAEVQLYHIIVEALNNIVKHAAATRVTLHLTRADGQLHLLIADDGRGFDPAQTKGGMGLRNIRERVARLNGQLSISSRPGDGTRLEAVIPYRAEEEE